MTTSCGCIATWAEWGFSFATQKQEVLVDVIFLTFIYWRFTETRHVFKHCSTWFFFAHSRPESYPGKLQSSNTDEYNGFVPCSRAPQWIKLTGAQRVSQSLSSDFIMWLEKATLWCDTNFSNLQATTSPLIRRIISLRLFGAAQCFLCSAADMNLMYCWATNNSLKIESSWRRSSVSVCVCLCQWICMNVCMYEQALSCLAHPRGSGRAEGVYLKKIWCALPASVAALTLVSFPLIKKKNDNKLIERLLHSSVFNLMCANKLNQWGIWIASNVM